MRYFKGLNTLRAIAAMIVVWGHIEYFKSENSIPNLLDNNFFLFPSAHIAVILFFVLSGFLITYLLTKEKEKNGDISFKKFYMRRILRIWPLYYLIIIISYVLFSTDYGQCSTKTTVLSLTILPNIAHALGEGWPYSPQIWSIGAEEQFYLLWPLLFSIIPEKRLLPSLFLFFIAYTILPNALGKIYPNEEFKTTVFQLFYTTKFNCMAIGAALGYALAKEKKWVNILNKDVIAFGSLILAFGLWFLKFESKYFTDEIFAIIFAIMLIGVVNNRKINIDTKVSTFLGKISYGIYMYHWIVILLVSKYIKYNGDTASYNFLLYFTVILLTILVSWVSFSTVEKFFLNLKHSFEVKYTLK
ncbi:acyltransferase family protein [Elizabethkingia miricola]|uniref:acyltransferase family protein n=1 Tax=Elizabethkingia miricola TaxID=172045 RepID=UPI0038915E77